jgi:cyclic-di-GMP-binding protein
MPSFDIESKIESHELSNAVDQANRELTNRFDFKGVEAKFELSDNKIILTAPEVFQTTQMQDILNGKLVKRGIDIQSLDAQPLDKNLAQAKLVLDVKQGIDQASAKKIVKFLKEKKLKVQAAIQGEQVRVTGKKRDDLQTTIAAIKEESFGLPLQFGNFRD